MKRILYTNSDISLSRPQSYTLNYGVRSVSLQSWVRMHKSNNDPLLMKDSVPMPRVLMFVPQYPYPILGGCEKQAHELSKALIRQGVLVHVISGKILSNQPYKESVEGVPVTRIPWSSRRILRFLAAPYVLWEFWKNRNSFDVIHLHHHSWVGLYIITLAKLLGKPILTKLNSSGSYGIPGMRNQSFGWLKLRLLLLSDSMVAMSGESVEEMKNVGFSVNQIFCTPNGITLYPQTSRSQALDPRRDRCRVVFVGRLTPEKQLNVLLEAWAKISAEASDVAILEIWGDGPLEKVLKKQAKDLGVDKSLKFTGYVLDVPRKLYDVDILVLPSSIEGNSNVILEAMAAGLPIVSTRVGGTPMMVGVEGQSLLVKSGDIEALSQILQQLINNREKRCEIGETMRKRSEMYFDINRIARTYTNAYKLLAKGGKHYINQVSDPIVK